MKERILIAAIFGLSIIVAAYLATPRYQMIVRGNMAWRVDRITGRTAICLPSNGGAVCGAIQEVDFADAALGNSR